MYITYDEVVLRYPMLNTWANSCFMVASDTIVYAEQCLNGMFATHFTVPFEAAHPTVKDLGIDLTYYALLNIKSPDKAEKLKDNVIGRINRIKDGKEYIMTGSYTILKPSRTAGAWSPVMDYHPVFCMLDTIDSIIDSDRLLDEEIIRGKYSHGEDLAETTSETVEPVLADFLFYTDTATVQTDVPFDITITALDSDSNIFSSFTDMVGLSISSGTLVPTITSEFIGGVWDGQFTISDVINDTAVVTLTHSGVIAESEEFFVSDPINYEVDITSYFTVSRKYNRLSRRWTVLTKVDLKNNSDVEIYNVTAQINSGTLTGNDIIIVDDNVAWSDPLSVGETQLSNDTFGFSYKNTFDDTNLSWTVTLENESGSSYILHDVS